MAEQRSRDRWGRSQASGRPRFNCRLFDPPLDAAAELRERQHPVPEHDVVERRDREPLAKTRASLLAEALDLEATNHVAGRLTGIGDVAVNLSRCPGPVLGGV